MPVQFGENFIVLQNTRGRPRSEAIIGYADFEFTDDEIFKLQQLYFKRYGTELVNLVSVSDFCGSNKGGRFFERILSPINRQSTFF